jgi:hypothetical protein
LLASFIGSKHKFICCGIQQTNLILVSIKEARKSSPNVLYSPEPKKNNFKKVLSMKISAPN